MMKASILTAVNEQIRHEQGNSRAYLAVSLYFGRLNLHGLEAFMARQVEEERMHAEKFIRHVADRGGEVELAALPAPKNSFASPLEAIQFVRELERTTTGAIHRLYELARKEGDVALEVLLHWYVTEQVEEEQWADELTSLVEQFHERPGQMFMLDHQWGKRAKEDRR
jgi:ferritin